MRRTLVTSVGIAALTLALASSALAAGSPISIGTPFDSGPPSVAVDASGNAVIAWANTKDLNGATDILQYCVLPVGAAACTQTQSLQPAGNASHIDGVQVLVDGSTDVILADVYGASTAAFEPVQEWQSTNGGATFTNVGPNGGEAVTNGNLDAVTFPLGGVILPGTNGLGFGWNTAGSASPTFHAFPLASPPECSEASSQCPGFATLQPGTNPDQIGNAGGEFAADSTGVLGVFNTDFTNGPLGCSNAQTVPFGTAFAYGSGNQVAGTNDYNISPGSAGSAWKNAVAQGDCNVEYVSVGAGPSGFGVLEDNDLTGTTVYHRFDTATGTFDTPMVTVSSHGEQQPAVSQDGAGGVYATFLSTGVGGPVTLSYSYNGGTTWSGPTALDTNSDGGVGNLTSSVNAAGQAWATWVDNGSVFAQSFTASDAVTPPQPTTVTTSQTAGLTGGPSITVPAGTLGEIDAATIAGTSAASAGGTLTYTLYSKAGCPAASAAAQSTVTVSGAKAPASAPVTVALGKGTYYWVAAYSGNAGNDQGVVGNLPSASSCGSEVLTIVAPATIGANASSNGQAITLSLTCAAVPCSGKVTLTVTEPVGKKASVASFADRKKAKTKTVTLGASRFTIKSKGAKKLKIALSKTGKSLLKTKTGSIKVSAGLTETIDGHAQKVTRTIKVTLPKKKHKK